MAHSHASLIANLALDAAALGYEDADIRFAVMMASHVYTEGLVRDYFARQFPREWPSAEVHAAREEEEKESARKAKKAAKRRRYRANRAAARKAAAEGNTAFDYGTAEPEEKEAEVESHSVVTDDDTNALLRSILRLAIEELEETDDEEESESESEEDTEEEAAPAVAPLPDVQKLSYKDDTVQSSVVRLKRGGVMEVRRNELTGAAIPDRKTWASAEAWRASLPNPNVTFDEDGCYTAIQEAEPEAPRQSAADRIRAYLLARAAFAKELKELGIVEKTIDGIVYYYEPGDNGLYKKVPGLNELGEYVGEYDSATNSIYPDCWLRTLDA